MQGGTYLVARRIRMRIASWDRASLHDQENTFGRKKSTGAPYTGEREFDTVDLDAVGASGKPVIPLAAHIRLAALAFNNGTSILRRGYSFTDGIDPTTGELDAGLFFIAFQRDPCTAFIAIQTRLATADALNEYIRHTGSAIFACPRGVNEGDYIASAIFA